MLKQLLQLLLNTRTTPEEAAHSAMPGTHIVEITPENDRKTTLVMPFDGYAYQTVPGGTGDSYSVIESDTKIYASQCNSTTGSSSRAFLPLSKGDTVVFTRPLDVAEQSFIRLVEVFGGGYNYLVKEVQLCLRTSCNSCLKLLSRVKRNGYLNSPTYRIKQQITQFLSSFLNQMEKVHLIKRTQHLMTVGLFVVIGLYQRYRYQTFQKTRLVMEKLGDLLTLTKISEFLSHVVKVITLNYGLGLVNQKTQLVTLDSYLKPELFRLAKGGLPC